jgi:DNA-directed RNA polymerase specialized sigma24 family protein
MVTDRRNKLDVREMSERILNRAEFLDPEDRALLEQVLERGVPPREIAVLSGRSTRSVQRRVRNLMRRLADPGVVCVLREHRRWERPTGAVALAVWVRGWTLRHTAERLGLSLHRVRQQVATVRGRIEARLAERENTKPETRSPERKAAR